MSGVEIHQSLVVKHVSPVYSMYGANLAPFRKVDKNDVKSLLLFQLPGIPIWILECVMGPTKVSPIVDQM